MSTRALQRGAPCALFYEFFLWIASRPFDNLDVPIVEYKLVEIA